MHVETGWRSLAMIVLCLLARPGSAAPFYATNASESLLLTEQDYLAYVSEDELPAARRAEVIGQATINQTHDMVGDDGTYFLIHEFVAPGLVTLSELRVLPDAAKAQKVVGQVIAGTQAGLRENGGDTVPIAGLENYYPGSQYFMITRDKVRGGNFFAVIRENRVYSVTLVGAGYFSNADNVREFLDRKIESLLQFKPSLAANARQASAGDLERHVQERQAQKQAQIVGLGILYTLAWIGGAAVAWIANRLAKRRVLAPLWLGACGVFVLVGFYMWAIFADPRAVVASAEMKGEMFGNLIFPALLVLVVVGFIASRRRTPTVPAPQPPLA